MLDIIDRRKNPQGKSLVNRQRFIRRAKEQIKEAVKKHIGETDIKDIANTKGKIVIPSKGIREPQIVHGEGGRHDRVVPGNKEYVPGDAIPKPRRGGGRGRGNEGSPDGEGQDDFQFVLNSSEFLDIFFEDLELPDMVKKQLRQSISYEFRRGGYTTVGNPSNLNIRQTMRNAFGRRIALRRPKTAELRELEAEIFRLEAKTPRSKEENERLTELHVEVQKLRGRMKSVPYVDPVDVRYNLHVKHPLPATQAVMFCLMDVSGSMSEHMKDLAKRFFMLLYLFLRRQYQRIDVVFIRHTHEAKEVDEETFFYDTETGGTVVSTSLELMDKIIRERYPLDQWNIYAAQASDGDNVSSDNMYCQNLLNEKILPIVQYYAFIEVGHEYKNWGNGETDLWRTYKPIEDRWDKFQMRKIRAANQIFPVFRELFKKEA